MRVQITGINESLKKIKSDFKKASNEVDAELAATCENILTAAKSYLPADYGQLKQSLRILDKKKFSYTIGSRLDYSAYVEFGTGPYAKTYVPSLEKEWQDYARKFKKTRDGNSPHHAYFYPAIRYYIITLTQRLEYIFSKYER